jgi:hypothetical protein
MKSKGEWFERFKEFQAFVKSQSEHEIKAFWCMSRVHFERFLGFFDKTWH